MTKKDLFRIIIKLFGLYSVINFITIFLSQFSFVLYSGIGNYLMGILYIIVILLFFVGFAWLLIFSPDIILKWFKLDSGFDDKDVKIEIPTLNNLLSMAIVIVGGFFIMSSFSPLFVSISNLLYNLIDTRGVIPCIDQNMDKNGLYVNIINLAVGYLLITNHRFLTNFLLSVNTKKD